MTAEQIIDIFKIYCKKNDISIHHSDYEILSEINYLITAYKSEPLMMVIDKKLREYATVTTETDIILRFNPNYNTLYKFIFVAEMIKLERAEKISTLLQ